MQDIIDDVDPVETQEWLDALESVAKNDGDDRAKYILRKLGEKANDLGVDSASALTTPYRNTISVKDEAHMPGDLFMERRILPQHSQAECLLSLKPDIQNSDLEKIQ